jgi:hypothetical protein
MAAAHTIWISALSLKSLAEWCVQVTGEQIEVRTTQDPSAFTFYDCYHGKQLQPRMAASEISAGSSVTRSVTLSFPIEAGGLGCLLRLSTGQNSTINHASLSEFLTEMATLTDSRPLRSFSREWTGLQQQLILNNATELRSASGAPDGMVLAPPGEFRFQIKGVGHEGSSTVQ